MHQHVVRTARRRRRHDLEPDAEARELGHESDVRLTRVEARAENDDRRLELDGGGEIGYIELARARCRPIGHDGVGCDDEVAGVPALADQDPAVVPGTNDVRLGVFPRDPHGLASPDCRTLDYRPRAARAVVGTRMIERRPIETRDWPWPKALHPVLRQVLARRALGSPQELELGLRHLVPVGRFDALNDAVDLLLAHRQRRIVIVGDFDADGATSTALCLLTLKRLGFDHVDYFIPDRFTLGYGLSAGVIAALGPTAPGLIVTVDNGIGSHDGVAAAREAGIDVLITDHHLPPDRLPDANVIVNPNLPQDDFPGKALAGVGVVFYLLAALGRTLDEPAAVSRYLDLVALGTVADLVPLDHSNRILVEQGLERIRAGHCRPGLSALCKVAGVSLRDVTAATLGYQVGPRLNAAGRLDDMSIGVRCLASDDSTEATQLATELDRLNRERRALETKMKAEAVDLVNDVTLEGLDGELPPAICLSRGDWHEGLVGLVASRIKERYHRPTFAFAPSADGELKGSGRSIPGFHLRDALAEVDAANPHLIKRFGGHAMAAGLSIAAPALADFEQAIVDVAASRVPPEAFARTILSDGPLAPADMNVAVANLLRDAGPWGQGFPEPCFDGHFDLLERRTLKDAHLKLKLRPEEGGAAIDAIAFNQAECGWTVGARRRIAYRLEVNDYFATHRVQLVVEHIDDSE